MPELTVIHLSLLALLTVAAAVAGWVLRGNRSEREKTAIGAGWQERMDAQRREHERLLEQNKRLMERVSRYRAADEDPLLHKDERIATLTKALENWQKRLPPLIERFRLRNAQAGRFEAELDEARERIRELETRLAGPRERETRIEPVHDAEELTDGLEASNDPDETAVDEIVTAVEDAVAQNSRPGVAPEGSFDDRDDLQRIRGVGPTIEKTLNELGIFRFEQIADMGEYDIDRVARRLKGFHSRGYREDWIGQARELLGQAARA
ncbi:MAG: hypothetical protein MJA32_05320 [Proteobacteria bacterium]|nr:hypothetical protein [Pseudomonadota bacterium]